MKKKAYKEIAKKQKKKTLWDFLINFRLRSFLYGANPYRKLL